eukprot:Blabericola_migrator_1__1184@NODE_1302_length_4860_cov_73_658043_g876_i0_p1_GENE_NODE_1302_length_4860_cov_73_658043_g876_i0NODE_1302_length_4860_cov_73_658043_g876_i0_p1_ORF_typecomplete_len1328_score219_09GCP_C_terminal/PF04130_13/4_7e03GCP_C_terminal/PF04130_13/5_2e36GCP_N_terminal/PF17681_1/2_4e30GCP_N_terminal/PF17681_1/5_5e03_NODE_1302_length_4860_cov_73_658043_g876_i08314814
MSAVHSVIDKFVASYCQTLFDEFDRQAHSALVPKSKPESIQIIHKLVISTVDIERYITQNELRRNTYACPPLETTANSLRRKLRHSPVASPATVEAGLQALDTILFSPIPQKKAELLSVLDAITTSSVHSVDSTMGDEYEDTSTRDATAAPESAMDSHLVDPGRSRGSGQDLMSTMTKATFLPSDEEPTKPSSDWMPGNTQNLRPTSLQSLERSRTSSFGKPDSSHRGSSKDAEGPYDMTSEAYPQQEGKPQNSRGPSDQGPLSRPLRQPPSNNPFPHPNRPRMPLDDPPRSRRDPEQGSRRRRPSARQQESDAEDFGAVARRQQRSNWPEPTTLLTEDYDPYAARPRRPPPPDRYFTSSDDPPTMTPSTDSRPRAGRPDEIPGSTRSWKPQADGTSLASLHRQVSGRLPLMPASPMGSSASADWKPQPSNDAMEERKRRARNKVNAALSIYPSTSEAIALVRDVIFCLQGVDGQHIQYVPRFEKFLLRKDIPIARPIRLLVSRMVASGDLFMQIHRAVSGNFSELLSFGHELGKGEKVSLSTDNAFCWRTNGGAVLQPSGKLEAEQVRPAYECHRPSLYPSNEAQHKLSLVVLAFLQGVKDELDDFYKDLGAMENMVGRMEAEQHMERILDNMPAPRIVFSSTTLRRLLVKLRPILKRIHGLAWLTDITAGQIGGPLLSIMNDARKSGDPNRGILADRLFHKAAEPLREWMREWVFEGKLSRDVYKEFFVLCRDSDTPDPKVKGWFSCWRDNIHIDWMMAPLFMEPPFVKRFYSVGRMAYFVKLVKGPPHFETLKSELSLRPHAVTCPAAHSNRELATLQQVPLLVAGALEDAKRITVNAFGHPLLSNGNDDMVVPIYEMSIAEVGLSQPPASSFRDETPWPHGEIPERFLDDLVTVEAIHRKDLHTILFEEEHLIDHLVGIKNFLLLGAGDFAEALLDQTSDLLVQRGCVSSIVQSEIDMCVLKAIESSVVAQLPEHMLDSVKAVRMLSEERFGRSSWDYFALDYQLQGAPVSVILRDELIVQYRRIFAFLWKIRRTVKHQHTLWFTTVSNAFLLHFPQVSDVLLQCQSLRCEVLHLLQSLESYFFTDIIEPAFNVMLNQVRSNEWKDLDDLISVQESFIQTLLYGTFLDEWPHPNTFKTQPQGFEAGNEMAFVAAAPMTKLRQGTLPDIHSMFLSSSCVLPAYAEKDLPCAVEEMTGGPRYIDDLLETSWSFALFMDSIQTSAFEIVSEAYNNESGMFEENDEEQEAVAAAFAQQYGPLLNELRFTFTQQLYTLLDFLTAMKTKYRSEAVSSLLTRLDLNSFYDRLRALEQAEKGEEVPTFTES